MLQAHLTKRSHVQCVAALAGMAAGGSPRLTACTRAQESALPLWAPGCIARRSALVTHCTRQRMCWRRGCTLSLQGASRTRRMARRMRACARARQPCRAASAQRLARKSALRARASAGTRGPPRRRAGRAGQGRARAARRCTSRWRRARCRRACARCRRSWRSRRAWRPARPCTCAAS